METHLASFIRDTPRGQEAESILRACVHCGFCTATCPTYQLLGDERDGPRGRIYLIKQLLEGEPASERTRLHLDRCLTCRACETTCPSGVNYHRLLDIGREVLAERLPRTTTDQLRRGALREGLSRPDLFQLAMGLGRLARPLLPPALAAKIGEPAPAVDVPWPSARHARRMLVLDGCVQPTLAPNINLATARVLDALGISLVRAPRAGCCGALRHHLEDPHGARHDMRRLIDAWTLAIDRHRHPDGSSAVEAIVITASGCGAHVKEYGLLLADDPAYAAKAAQIAALARDVSEVVADALDQTALAVPRTTRKLRVAFQSPCTLQHGQRIRGVVERVLVAAGCELTAVADGHLCCGSAGTYSLLQPELSERLRKNKLAALMAGGPQLIVTANIGCQSHLQGASRVPVRHWVELLADIQAGVA